MPAPSPLILASTSPYRRAQLERLGLAFECRAPGLDEQPFKTRGLAPMDLARTLALAKASAVARDAPGALVIGGDQVVALGQELLGKPGSAERAVEQLERLAGRTHELHSAVALVGPAGAEVHVESARLTMASWTRDELAAYVQRDRPLDCAGAYKLEAGGLALFERIRCDDWSAIEGLPLLWLAQRLRAARGPAG